LGLAAGAGFGASDGLATGVAGAGVVGEVDRGAWPSGLAVGAASAFAGGVDGTTFGTGAGAAWAVGAGTSPDPNSVNGWLHLGHKQLAPGGSGGRLIDWRQ